MSIQRPPRSRRRSRRDRRCVGCAWSESSTGQLTTAAREMRRDRGRSRPRCGGERARRLTTAARRDVSAFEPRPARVSSKRAPNELQTSSKRAPNELQASSKRAPSELKPAPAPNQLQASSKRAPRQLQQPSFNLVQSGYGATRVELRLKRRVAAAARSVFEEKKLANIPVGRGWRRGEHMHAECLRGEEACRQTSLLSWRLVAFAPGNFSPHLSFYLCSLVVWA